MEWDSVSSEAKRILSLIKDLVTGDYHLDANICIQLGAMFEKSEVKEMITQEVFDEIVSFTRDDDKIRALDPGAFLFTCRNKKTKMGLNE